MKRPSVLLVDDEASIRFAVRDYLEMQGWTVEEAADGRSARAALRSSHPDAIVLDYRLPDGDTLTLLSEIKAVHPTLPVVVLTGHASVDLAVTAVKLGADHFLTKPVELATLLVILQRLLASRKVMKRDAAVRSRSAVHAVDPFVGTSEALQRLRADAESVAGSDRTVLVCGETGSGKGVLARWLHRSSPRCDEPFVELNCAGFGRDLVESELFGHERGAFTGAVTKKAGLLEIADGGSVFLDEIGDMDLPMQAKLLKVVEEKQFRRVGELHDRYSDIRLIAATHRDLVTLAREEKFRSDLYFRISTITLNVPPLRRRVEDIPMLAETFLRSLGSEIGAPERELHRDAISALESYSWPGNVRELRNVIERALLLSHGSRIAAADLRFDFDGRGLGATVSGTADKLADVERLHVLRVVGEENGNVERAAVRLGIPRSTLYQKMKSYKGV
ncbi:MAG TPA: sigma-54 dependent transcriptional regulator [Thermoanaerobaculia bacterium]